MRSQGVQPVKSVSAVSPDWLWTWNGLCFGYRQGDSLFTYDGTEVGRFSGNEVYGVDGRYLGELSGAGAGKRLISNLYKKWNIGTGFEPTFGRAYKRLRDRTPEPLYTGHEDFPSPESVRTTVFR